VLRRTATLYAIAGFGAASLLGADRLGVIPGSAKPQRTGDHLRSHQRGLHIRVREASLWLEVVEGSRRPDRYTVVFKETVTNTGTLPVPGVLVRPRRPSPHSGWVYPGTNCGVGDVSNAGKFNFSQTKPGPPINGELCEYKGGLKPGKTTVVAYLMDFATASKANACDIAGANVVTLTPRQTAAYAKSGFSIRGFGPGTYGPLATPSTSVPTISS